jgi:hypothetical protein
MHAWLARFQSKRSSDRQPKFPAFENREGRGSLSGDGVGEKE